MHDKLIDVVIVVIGGLVYSRCTFDTHEDGQVRVAETVGDRAEIVELIAAVQTLNVKHCAANSCIIRRHHVTQTDADVTAFMTSHDDVTR